MILMAMGNDQAANLLPVFLKIGLIRNDVVNAQHISLGEDGAAINHDDIIAVFNGGHVLSDL